MSGGHFFLAGHSNITSIVAFDLRSEPLYGESGLYYWEVFLSGGHFFLAGHSNISYIVKFDLGIEPLYG